MNKNLKSNCCHAPVKLGGIGDFNDKDEIGTRYYICSDCNKPCDLEENKVDAKEPISKDQEGKTIMEVLRLKIGCELCPDCWNEIKKAIDYALNKTYKDAKAGACPDCHQTVPLGGYKEPINSFEEKVLREFDKEFYESHSWFEVNDHIKQAFKEQRQLIGLEFKECLPTIRNEYWDGINQDREVIGFNECLDKILQNLKDKGVSI